MNLQIISGVTCIFLATSSAAAADWTQWRGPSRMNLEPNQNVPTEFSDSENVIWKSPVKGRGHSSPIVVGDTIILTSADEPGQQQGVFAFDRATGKELWGQLISTGGFPKTHNKNTHASSTPCSDGTNVYVIFHHHDKVEAAALNLKNGGIVWRKDVGPFAPKAYEYGYAASPTLYNGTLIITGDNDTSAWMKALDTKTGQVVWNQSRPGMLTWSSPVVANVAGREQLIVSGCEQIAAYNPKDGQPLWNQKCLTMATCGTVVWDADTVYASGGYPKKETVAMKADGSGRILWKNGVKCYEQSMLLNDGYLYGFDDNGIMYCWEAKSGREMWKKRLQGPVSASPLLVGDNIYAANERGTFFVFKANPQQFELVKKNQLGNESFATPTVVDNILYIRVAAGQGGNRQEMLYAIGNRD